MLSFELKHPKIGELSDELEIFLDRDGLESLLAQLMLLKGGKTEHVHLMTESWGGTHLEDAPHGSDSIAIRHVKILLR
ncbi:MAG: Imm32 family immunity protein [Candidatus Binatia bacterium]